MTQRRNCPCGFRCLRESPGSYSQHPKGQSLLSTSKSYRLHGCHAHSINIGNVRQKSLTCGDLKSPGDAFIFSCVS